MNIQDVVNILKPLAEQTGWCDWEDLNPYEASGGNYDDAYYGGVDSGRIGLARKILTMLEIPFIISLE